MRDIGTAPCFYNGFFWRQVKQFHFYKSFACTGTELFQFYKSFACIAAEQFHIYKGFPCTGTELFHFCKSFPVIVAELFHFYKGFIRCPAKQFICVFLFPQAFVWQLKSPLKRWINCTRPEKCFWQILCEKLFLRPKDKSECRLSKLLSGSGYYF